MQPKEIEYIKILINLDESLMITLININLKASQSKVTEAREGGGQRGRGVYFYNNAKELLQKLTLIIGEMEAGNNSIEMRNTGQSILDALLRSKAMNKAQYQKLVKKHFKI